MSRILALAYGIRHAFESQDRRGRRFDCANVCAVGLGRRHRETATGLNTGLRGALLGSAFAFAIFSGAGAAEYRVIHDFAGPPNDGADPSITLTPDNAGNLYGTTLLGGASNAGIVFRIAPDGTETVLHSFAGHDAGDGANPFSPVTVDQSTGDLYGTTQAGGDGAGCSYGCGTIWKLAANGTYSVLHSFDGIYDGIAPIGRLIRDNAGNFYGIVSTGPGTNYGGVYRYSIADGLNVLVLFNGQDGIYPSSLTADKAGNLYGTTVYGGGSGCDGYGCGTIFELMSGEFVFKTLYVFTGGNGGVYPLGGLDFDKDGNIYGSAWHGGDPVCDCGVTFKLAPDGAETVLHAFTGGADGAWPQTDVLLVGKNLYGSAAYGGNVPECSCGVVFKLAPDGTETALHTLTGGDGIAPGGLAKEKHDGLLYGTTATGGAYGYGVVFSVTKK